MTEQQQSAIPAGFDNGDDYDPDAGTLEVFPPAREPAMAALGTLHEHVVAMREAVYFAEGMCYTEMVPQRFRGKPKDAAAAILFGAEVGLSPIAALRSVIVIHGQPGFEARTMKAILIAKGYRFRSIEKTAIRAEMWAWAPDSPVVICDDDKSPHWGRRIVPDDVAVWTIEDAVQAGFVPTKLPNGKWETNTNGKLKGNMKYIETPKVMLDAKVTAEVSRSIAPHILLGLPFAAEEMAEINDALEGSWRRPDLDGDTDDDAPRKRGVGALRNRAKAARAKTEPPVDAEEVDLSDATIGDLVPETVLPVDDPQTVPDPSPRVDSPAPSTPDGAVTNVEGTTGEDLPGPGATPEPVPVAPEPDAGGDREATAAAGHPAATADRSASDTPAAAGTATSNLGAKPEPTQAAAADDSDLAMTPAVRQKGVDMLVGLLINGDITEEYRADALSEVAAKRPAATYRRINDVDALTNTELKFLVDTLREWKAKDQLMGWLGEAVNNASLREAGMLPE